MLIDKYYLEYEKEALNNGNFSVASYYGVGPVFKVDSKVDLDKVKDVLFIVNSSLLNFINQLH